MSLYSIYSLTVIIIKRFKEKEDAVKNKKLRKRGFLLLPLFNFFYQPFNNLFRFQLADLSCIAGFEGYFPCGEIFIADDDEVGRAADFGLADFLAKAFL